ncbi:MAG: hypothetical protein V3T70_03525 [Phycisphaerae bacterium]
MPDGRVDIDALLALQIQWGLRLANDPNALVAAAQAGELIMLSRKPTAGIADALDVGLDTFAAAEPAEADALRSPAGADPALSSGLDAEPMPIYSESALIIVGLDDAVDWVYLRVSPSQRLVLRAADGTERVIGRAWVIRDYQAVRFDLAGRLFLRRVAGAPLSIYTTNAGCTEICDPPPDPCQNDPDPCCGSSDPCCGSSDPCCGSNDRCCDAGDPCCGSPDPCCDPSDPCCGNPDRCCNSDNPCCNDPDPCCNPSDSCCGDPNRCCNSDNPCCNSPDPCCNSNDPCCNNPDRCCNSDNPCCNSPDPCCNSIDPCCNNPDRCCNSDNPCCGDPDPCCDVNDPCCGNSDPCCNPDNPCCGVDCDDGDPCTLDTCLDSVCYHETITTVTTDPCCGIDCDDGDPCTLDTCLDGVCYYETVTSDPCCILDCNDNDPCTIDTCVNGACQHEDDPDPCCGINCNDNDPCTIDYCTNGVCMYDPSPDPCCYLNCNDFDACTIDTCVNGACQHTPDPDPCCGFNCDDGDPCTIDWCDNGVCLHGPDPDPCCTLDCDDGDPCTIDICTNGGVCVHPPLPASCLVDLAESATCATDVVTLPLTITNTSTCSDVFDWFIVSLGPALHGPVPSNGTIALAGGASFTTSIDVILDISGGGGSSGTLEVQVSRSGESTVACTDTTTIQVPLFPIIEVRYKSFIRCNLITLLGTSYFEGDDRLFDYGSTAARSFQQGLVTLDPNAAGGGLVGLTMFSGITRKYDPAFVGDTGIPPCPYVLTPGAPTSCQATATGGLFITVTPIATGPNTYQAQFHISLSGDNPCQNPSPAINAEVDIWLRQVCLNGVLQPAEFSASGAHDGYPWHELYMNGSLRYGYDPTAFGNGPIKLFPPMDIVLNLMWQPVPNQ